MREEREPNVDWVTTQLANAPDLTDDTARRITTHLWGAQ